MPYRTSLMNRSEAERCNARSAGTFADSWHGCIDELRRLLDLTELDIRDENSRADRYHR